MIQPPNASNLPVHLIVDEQAHSGLFNMALDEALLEIGATRDFCVCRIYRWEEPTVTLGYFQASQPDQENPFPALPVVRRLSGGGAILHDLELTYSCVLPANHPVRHDPSQLYLMVHEALIELLRSCGCGSLLRSDFLRLHETSREEPRQGAEKESFLCFLRQNPNDIVEAKTGQKVVGSAQRRRRGVILQHGSILMRASKLASDIPGICDLCPEFDEGRFVDELPSAVAGAIGAVAYLRNCSADEMAKAAELMNAASG